MQIPKLDGFHPAEELLHVAEHERGFRGSRYLNIWQIVGRISTGMGL